MATVQSTAHLLKGAAANLRIDPLAKTLETLQHNEDPEKVPALFDRFVGQLKALKNLIHPHGLN
jgi:HPt (histidine-containing phosphotransfer) domain-containing protein